MAITITLSSSNNNVNVLQEGDSLIATTDALSTDNVTYQWQRSNDGFASDVENVTGIPTAKGGAPASIYQ